MSVLIVGGGWAGLACAARLALAGERPTLLEAAPALGGRARTVPLAGLELDNGQHLAIGAYRRTLALLNDLGVSEADAFLRLPLRLEQRAVAGEDLVLAPPALPAPFHLLAALARAAGLPGRQRRAALGLCLRLAARRFRIHPDRPLEPWLRDQGQDRLLIERLWEPLCVATLNTPVETASTRVFLRVLRDTFARRRADSDLLIPRRPLGELLPRAAAARVRASGGAVHPRRRVRGLWWEGERLRGVITDSGPLPGARVVLAVPPFAARRLLPETPALAPLRRRLAAFEYQPIATVWLGYDGTTRLPFPILGLADGPGQWIFDRGACCGQAGVMAVVVSAEGPHSRWPRAVLGERVAAQLAALFPHWPAPRWTQVVTEKRATFACTVAGAAQRPGTHTPVPGLFLAGDYLDTGYPATLEGAVMAGEAAARACLSA